MTLGINCVCIRLLLRQSVHSKHIIRLVPAQVSELKDVSLDEDLLVGYAISFAQIKKLNTVLLVSLLPPEVVNHSEEFSKRVHLELKAHGVLHDSIFNDLARWNLHEDNP